MIKNTHIAQRAYIVAFVLLLVSLGGCSSALFAPFYLIKGMDVDPEFKKEIKEIPKESKFVVVCRSGMNLFGQENPNAPLSLCITHLMSKKLPEKKKFEWISYDKVESSFDETTLLHETFTNLGKKVNADYVVGVDLDSFSTHLSSQLYQGRAKVHVQLIKVSDGEVIARKTLPEYVYPPTPVPANGKDVSEFQKQFIGKLAHEIGSLFYPYDKHAKYAVDNDFPDR